MNDKQIKEKIGSLDTLSAGIVYGREQAWDKLQARIDRKPVRKFPIGYWMAAAAVILLMVCIMPLYLHQKQAVAQNNIPPVITAQPNKAIAQQPEPAIAQPDIAKTVVIKKITADNSRHTIATIPQNKEQLTNAIKPEVIIPENKTAEAPGIENNVVVASSQASMKIVHINDIENKNAAQGIHAIAAANNDLVDLKKMRVVHITDVVNEEHEMKMLLHENRMTFGRNPFSRMINSDTYPNSNTEENEQPHHLLKNIFNTQN